MLPELISKVYVINLKSSTDRRKHIKKEFSKFKITNFLSFLIALEINISLSNRDESMLFICNFSRPSFSAFLIIIINLGC